MSTNVVPVQGQLIDIGSSRKALRRFTYARLLEHLRNCSLEKKESKQWCTVKELAGIFHGRATERNCEAMRTSLSKAFPIFVAQKVFMAIEYAPFKAPGRGKKLSVRIYNGESGSSLQHVMEKLDRMRKRKEFTEKIYLDAEQLIMNFAVNPKEDAQKQA